MQEIISISSIPVQGKRVLLRTSLNVPLSPDGSVSDESRLQAALPTIKWLSAHGAKTVIVAYLGHEGASLASVATALSRLLPEVAITFFSGSLAEARSEVEKLSDGACLLIENIRKETGEETNDLSVAQALAALADIYVNDAFADSHRAYASVVGVAALLPSYAGLLMMKEIMHLSLALTPPPHAIAIIGGAKFQTKEPLILKLLKQYEKIFLGGAIANDILKARNISVGASLVSGSVISPEIAHNDRLIVPIDGIVTDIKEEKKRQTDIHDVRSDERIVDIGARTASAWVDEILKAPFVVWNGPVGIYEKNFITGTDALAEALSHTSGTSVLGGGDTLAAVRKFSFNPEQIFLSTGGGAMLEFLTDGTLVGIDALRKH